MRAVWASSGSSHQEAKGNKYSMCLLSTVKYSNIICLLSIERKVKYSNITCLLSIEGRVKYSNFMFIIHRGKG